jgi:hypothetical protein
MIHLDRPAELDVEICDQNEDLCPIDDNSVQSFANVSTEDRYRWQGHSLQWTVHAVLSQVQAEARIGCRNPAARCKRSKICQMAFVASSLLANNEMQYPCVSAARQE